MRAFLALGLLVAFFAYGIGVRVLLYRRRTGSTPFRFAHVSPAQRLAGTIGLIGVVGGAVAAARLEAGGTLEAWHALDPPAYAILGVLVALAGFAGTQWAISAMGASWRIGVEESERTHLVTDGPFRYVRNPIYTSMLIVGAGLLLVLPNVGTLGGVALLFVALEIVVRASEEPYLLRTHGDAYAEYASRVGRFLPGVGRLRLTSSSA